MAHHVQIKDIKNRSVRVRIERHPDFMVPIWKALTVGRFRVPVGMCEPDRDGLLLFYDDAMKYGAIKYGRFKIALLRDFWEVKDLKVGDLGNAVIYDEGVTNFEGGIGMWSKA
jgi:hypothetical protein